MGDNVEDIFRINYRELSPKKIQDILELKERAYLLYYFARANSDISSRAFDLFRIKLEEAIMWVFKGIT